MNTTFLLSGGIGRVITSIPALEKFHKLNPEDDFKVLVNGWENVFWSHPILQNKTFDPNQKGSFELYVKNNNLVVPEPYNNYNFYNQKTNLIESFDEIINCDLNHTDLKDSGYLYLNTTEKNNAKQNIAYYKDFKQVKKVIVFQPYGSTAQQINNDAIDDSNRSLSVENYFEIVKTLSKHAAIIFMGQTHLRHVDDNISIYLNDDPYYIRNMIGLISECDFFLGVDSVGQHIAKSFNKPGMILMGGTDERNYSYPNHFKIFRKEGSVPLYAPWRISDTDSNYSNRLNDGMMEYTKDEIKEICNLVIGSL